ncbi:Protein of unknown function (DUF3122) [Pleurocapsa sp. PCC 7327]|uniref:DUF3122 domain-containing protein n=1 Tax=Pleurocapsa sp. PCC 7327 TaxID=118163 RepID=UPI00029FF16C|nr:DUF3122 domain-containing protein [Pleurocapsa sp. PCC 7327]AFY78148.1 Protein of unknown function (DUF3122) [Pleurocapsa sp. PCC 7327]
MWCRIRQIFSWLVLLGTLILLLLLGLGIFSVLPAAAAIRQMEEAPGQILQQSRHTLRDEKGNAWQVVLFKRVKADGSTTVNLRLVGFPGTVAFAHPQPLKITTNQGEILVAEDLFAQKAPAPNVGQYDLKNILPQLPIAGAVHLSLVMNDDRAIDLSIPAEVTLEWQTIAAQ